MYEGAPVEGERGGLNGVFLADRGGLLPRADDGMVLAGAFSSFACW